MTEPLGVTPSQTVGPFYAIGLPWEDGPYVVPAGTPGSFEVHGTVYDGAGEAVPDALIETWQADPDGRFAHPDDPRGAVKWDAFRGFARVPTTPEGTYAFRTVRPGRLPSASGELQAPYIAVSVFARGLLNRVVTRIYFGDEAEANAADPVLRSLAGDAERATLVAAPSDRGYRFDVHVQGDHETVFFSI
ncbi:MAG: protocatechuate 3,4-dioxygenase subunit alpha [Streptosporangiales bacterium]|nr:protocatechuate 3,4-dioxygenase subunit alpha [Streptosporangiales bacterium]